MVQVYLTRIEEALKDEEYEALYEKVSDYRRQKADRLKQPEDKIRSLIAGALFQYGLARFFAGGKAGAGGICQSVETAEAASAQKTQDFQVRLGNVGKPFVDGVEFNLSHAGIYVAAAFGIRPVGIDVEGGREPSDRIASRFHPRERDWYKMGDLDNTIEKQSRFYRIWTAKESVMKRDGRGIAMGLNSFCVFDEGLKDEIYSVPLDENYWLSLCSSEEWDGEIQRVEIKDLLGV